MRSPLLLLLVSPRPTIACRERLRCKVTCLPLRTTLDAQHLTERVLGACLNFECGSLGAELRVRHERPGRVCKWHALGRSPRACAPVRRNEGPSRLFVGREEPPVRARIYGCGGESESIIRGCLGDNVLRISEPFISW